MKASPLRLALLSGVAALAFARSASADVISGFEFSEYRTSNYYAYYQANHTLTTSLAVSPGLTLNPTSPLATGWSLERNDNLYISFTITPQTSYQVTFTDLTSDPRRVGTTDGPTSFYWGIRINEGSGYGAWTFSDVMTFGALGTFQPWDFADVTTSGSVQFGFFAYGGTNPARGASPGAETGNYEVQEISVNGSVSAVPEPSTVALCVAGAVFALVIMRRRRAA
jgi:hypothetical protein